MSDAIQNMPSAHPAQPHHVDLMIIGLGIAGSVAAINALNKGKSVAAYDCREQDIRIQSINLSEKIHQAIPTLLSDKILRTLAEKILGKFGHLGVCEIRDLVNALQMSAKEKASQSSQSRIFTGPGHKVDYQFADHKIIIDGQTITFTHLMIATGALPKSMVGKSDIRTLEIAKPSAKEKLMLALAKGFDAPLASTVLPIQPQVPNRATAHVTFKGHNVQTDFTAEHNNSWHASKQELRETDIVTIAYQGPHAFFGIYGQYASEPSSFLAGLFPNQIAQITAFPSYKLELYTMETPCLTEPDGKTVTFLGDLACNADSLIQYGATSAYAQAVAATALVCNEATPQEVIKTHRSMVKCLQSQTQIANEQILEERVESLQIHLKTTAPTSELIKKCEICSAMPDDDPEKYTLAKSIMTLWQEKKPQNRLWHQALHCLQQIKDH